MLFPREQFSFLLYDHSVVCVQLDVTGLNYVSRREEPLVLMTVEHAAFSPDGQWLATVSKISISRAKVYLNVVCRLNGGMMGRQLLSSDSSSGSSLLPLSSMSVHTTSRNIFCCNE